MDPEALFDSAKRVLDCVSTALTGTDGVVAPEWFAVTVGRPPFEECCVGMVYAYVDRVFPFSVFPQEVVDADPCSIYGTAADVVVGIVRCAPTGDDRGSPIPAAELEANAREVLLDTYALWRGLLCCAATGDVDAVVGAVGPLDAQGGCVGTEGRITVEVDGYCPCG